MIHTVRGPRDCICDSCGNFFHGPGSSRRTHERRCSIDSQIATDSNYFTDAGGWTLTHSRMRAPSGDALIEPCHRPVDLRTCKSGGGGDESRGGCARNFDQRDFADSNESSSGSPQLTSRRKALARWRSRTEPKHAACHLRRCLSPLPASVARHDSLKSRSGRRT